VLRWCSSVSRRSVLARADQCFCMPLGLDHESPSCPALSTVATAVDLCYGADPPRLADADVRRSEPGAGPRRAGDNRRDRPLPDLRSEPPKARPPRGRPKIKGSRSAGERARYVCVHEESANSKAVPPLWPTPPLSSDPEGSLSPSAPGAASPGRHRPSPQPRRDRSVPGDVTHGDANRIPGGSPCIVMPR
jgi:hypothetical protein